ncbi:MAG: hypothetical protein E5Y30_14020 [Mesorhizobium sp.]|nr:MAG: hypothetical protein E5Y30_14020 [Mesorhizobium sp.]
MHTPTSIGTLFFNSFDASARDQFRRFVQQHSIERTWIIAADFALRDPNHALDCMAFTVMPFNKHPREIRSDIVTALPKDLKRSRDLTPEGIARLRDNSAFHVIITMGRKRAIFNNGDGAQPIEIARAHIEMTVAKLQSMGGHPDQLKRFQQLQQKAIANNFNVRLMSDIWLLGVFFSSIAVALAREAACDSIIFMPDRDDMTNFGNNVWLDYVYWDIHALCSEFELDMRTTKVVGTGPDTSGPQEVMWYDYMIRSADWFAGAMASYNRVENKVPGPHLKYLTMVEKVVADAQNVVVLHFDVDKIGTQFRRVVISKSDPSQTGNTVPVV